MKLVRILTILCAFVPVVAVAQDGRAKPVVTTRKPPAPGVLIPTRNYPLANKKPRPRPGLLHARFRMVPPVPFGFHAALPPIGVRRYTSRSRSRTASHSPA